MYRSFIPAWATTSRRRPARNGRQLVDELLDLLRELRRLRLQLLQRLGQAMRDLHVLAPQLPHQFHVVVARHAQRRARRTIDITSFSTSTTFGPRSTRSPRNTAFRPPAA